MTNQEKSTKNPPHQDMDDAVLGRLVKRLAAIHEEPVSAGSLKSTSAAIFLISEALRTGAAEMEVKLTGASYFDKDLGDWKITIEKLEQPTIAERYPEWAKTSLGKAVVNSHLENPSDFTSFTAAEMVEFLESDPIAATLATENSSRTGEILEDALHHFMGANSKTVCYSPSEISEEPEEYTQVIENLRSLGYKVLEKTGILDGDDTPCDQVWITPYPNLDLTDVS